MLPGIRSRGKCAIIALVWLSLVTVGFTFFRHFPCDFGQYYMGGLIAREGLWAELYPDPIPGVNANVGEPDGSVMQPGYARLAHETRADEYELFRFTQPPPAALVFLPFGLLPFFPSYCLFMAMMVLCTWAIALQAGAICARCFGKAGSRWSGVVVLIVAFSPISYRILRAANISPLIGALIGAAILCILANRAFSSALSIAVGALLKYATAVLLPVMIAMRQWRAAALTIIFWASAIGASLLITGSAPFEKFVNMVFPNMMTTRSGTLNQSLESVLIRLSGDPALPAAWNWPLRASELGVIVLISVLLARSPRESWPSAPRICAACAAMISWLLIYSPILWAHYLAYVMPLWGWIIWELTQPKRRLLAFAALALTWIAVPAPLAGLFPRAVGAIVMAHVLIGAALILVLSIWRLATAKTSPIQLEPERSSAPANTA